MSTQVQFRRGTAAQNNSFTGASGEITVDTTNTTLRVHDGVTAGGFAVPTLSAATGNLDITGNINATANVTGNYFLGNGSLLTGIISSVANINDGTSNLRVTTSGGNIAANVGATANLLVLASTGAYVAGLISATGNLTSGNISTGIVSATGNLSTTGNVTGNYILGNGALLTGVITSVANINNGTSNVTVVSSGGNVTVGVGGTSNVAVFSSGGLAVSGTANLVGSTSAIGALFSGIRERVNVTGTAADGNLNINLSTAPIWFYNANSTSNVRMNLCAGSGNNFGTLTSTGEAVTFTVLMQNGATGYFANTIQVDGTTSGVSTKWLGNVIPISGSTNSVDVYSFSVVKTAASTYTVLASQTRYA